MVLGSMWSGVGDEGSEGAREGVEEEEGEAGCALRREGLVLPLLLLLI